MMESSVSVHGLVRVGATLIALPADRIVEAVDVPASYHKVPAQPSAMRGYFVLRGDAVATLDTFSLLNPGEAAPGPARHVIVLRHGEALFGIEVDAIGNTETVDDRAVVRLEASFGEHGGLFPRLFSMEGGLSLIGIADVSKLYAATEGMAARAQGRASGAGPGSGPASGHVDDSGAQARQYAIVRCAEHLLCVDALSVRAVVPMPALQQPTRGNTTFLGVAHWAGGDLAVMDLSAVLGLPIHKAADGKYMLVFENGETLAGFAVDDLSELLLVGSGDIRPVSPVAFRHAHLFSGAVVSEKGHTALLVDPQALAMSEGLVRLPRPRAKPGVTSTNELSRVPAPTSFIVFSAAGKHLAVKTAQVAEIVSKPQIEIRGRQDEASLGLINWRDSLIELVSLRAVTGVQSNRDWEQALVVNVNGLTLAFAIDAVITMSGPNEATEVSRIADHETGEWREILTMGELRRASYRIVDLSHLVISRFRTFDKCVPLAERVISQASRAPELVQ